MTIETCVKYSIFMTVETLWNVVNLLHKDTRGM
jgi:hypothetical protein